MSTADVKQKLNLILIYQNSVSNDILIWKPLVVSTTCYASLKYWFVTCSKIKIEFDVWFWYLYDFNILIYTYYQDA